MADALHRGRPAGCLLYLRRECSNGPSAYPWCVVGELCTLISSPNSPVLYSLALALRYANDNEDDDHNMQPELASATSV